MAPAARPGTSPGEVRLLCHFSRVSGAAHVYTGPVLAGHTCGGKHSQLEWNKEMGKAFLATKAALTDATHLAHPVQEVELSLAVDASNHHLGAALQQRTPGGEWHLLSFFSRKLTDTEMRYSTFNRELLAVVAALCHFQFLLEERKFHMLTDHNALFFAL